MSRLWIESANTFLKDWEESNRILTFSWKRKKNLVPNKLPFSRIMHSLTDCMLPVFQQSQSHSLVPNMGTSQLPQDIHCSPLILIPAYFSRLIFPSNFLSDNFKHQKVELRKTCQQGSNGPVRVLRVGLKLKKKKKCRRLGRVQTENFRPV